MNPKNLLEKLRELIGHIAWKVFLWSLKMNQEEYLNAIYKQERELRE